jgi:hypothetical protein
MSHPTKQLIPGIAAAAWKCVEVTALQNFPDSPFPVSRSGMERRAKPRYTFLALVELTETAGVMCIQGRLRDVSTKGCYVNTPSTFPASTALSVVIARGEETFRSNSKVVYVHDGIGMGLAFVDTTNDQVEMLNSWLVGLASTEML